eukprot:scaffold240521_cov33-Prasinocladus_malaysianus.AAC.1
MPFVSFEDSSITYLVDGHVLVSCQAHNPPETQPNPVPHSSCGPKQLPRDDTAQATPDESLHGVRWH